MITDIEYGLLPCPICGKRFHRTNIHLYNDESELIGDMESATDLDNITDPCNAVSYETMKGMTKLDLQQAVGIYLDSINEVSTVAVVCECGYGMSFDRWKSNYPDQGWFAEFEDAVNRRSVKAMETTLKHIIDHACGGPVRQRYMDALIALLEVRRLQERHEEDEKEGVFDDRRSPQAPRSIHRRPMLLHGHHRSVDHADRDNREVGEGGADGHRGASGSERAERRHLPRSHGPAE